MIRNIFITLNIIYNNLIECYQIKIKIKLDKNSPDEKIASFRRSNIFLVVCSGGLGVCSGSLGVCNGGR